MKKKRLRNPAEVMRDEMYMQRTIQSLLRDNPLTIPEIAQNLHMPSHEIVFWMMAMIRYGFVTSMPKGRIDDYYQYKLKDE